MVSNRYLKVTFLSLSAFHLNFFSYNLTLYTGLRLFCFQYGESIKLLVLRGNKLGGCGPEIGEALGNLSPFLCVFFKVKGASDKNSSIIGTYRFTRDGSRCSTDKLQRILLNWLYLFLIPLSRS